MTLKSPAEDISIVFIWKTLPWFAFTDYTELQKSRLKWSYFLDQFE